jgi:hypothetical protein
MKKRCWKFFKIVPICKSIFRLLPDDFCIIFFSPAPGLFFAQGAGEKKNFWKF